MPNCICNPTFPQKNVHIFHLNVFQYFEVTFVGTFNLHHFASATSFIILYAYSGNVECAFNHEVIRVVLVENLCRRIVEQYHCLAAISPLNIAQPRIFQKLIGV